MPEKNKNAWRKRLKVKFMPCGTCDQGRVLLSGRVEMRLGGFDWVRMAPCACWLSHQKKAELERIRTGLERGRQ
jgi:hypothetical protein